MESENRALSASEAPDSRTFGPLPLSAVEGRVLYALRSPSDHGRIATLGQLHAADEAVLTCELSIDRLVRVAEGGADPEEGRDEPATPPL